MQKRASSKRQYLHVVKASAGSGKTHRLTGEYLRLLFSMPNAYRHILAVTFTNKATDEMKSRIVKELYNLGSEKRSDYLQPLSDEFGLSETDVREQARHILETILHDYSAFSISTIDRFFQQTMRAFTREMGLSGGYNIEVDENAFLPEVIDTMLAELDRPENRELARWLLAFMKDRIENNKGWSIKKEVQELAAEIFNEKYKSLSQSEKEKIQDKKHLAGYKPILTKIVRDFEAEVKTIGEKGVNLIHRSGLHFFDFKGGRNSPFSHFLKWANGEIKIPTTTFVNLADNLDGWVTKETSPEKRSIIESVYFDGLNEQVKSAVALFCNNRHYNSALAILNLFYALGILNDVQRRLQQLQQDENILFLSDTTELLNKIIADSDSPFIYEKTGTHLLNYMIDEFQDTSSMQWNNFRPLISESLANNCFNLIVGDVKQSIYRWRNSDWRLLEEHVLEDFRSDSIHQHSLDTNWRSDANIVRFNNAFFTLAPRILQKDYNRVAETVSDETFKQYVSGKINEAYKQACQYLPERKSGNEGQTEIAFLDTRDDWKALALERLPKQLERLQDEGFCPKDIAVMVRWNSEAVKIAETLLEYREAHPHSPYCYNVVSNEALVIGNSQSVKAAVALLRWFRNRNHRTQKMLAVYEFYRFHRKASPDETLQIIFGNGNIDFPESVRTQLHEISHLPFYEMIEAFFALSKNAIDEKENAYVQAFLDTALRFGANASSDIDDFLNWWDEKGCRKTLYSPDDQNAIRLITIHKSKGLGFGAVVMPFVDWDIDHNPHHHDIVWCRPDIAPFNKLSILPLRYGKNLIDTIFWKDYLEEKLFTYIDNLNLLYVAFTRAKHRLIVFAPKPDVKKRDVLKNTSDLLWQTISEKYIFDSHTDLPLIPLHEYLRETDDEAFFSFGSVKITSIKEHSPYISPKSVRWQSVPFDNRLKMRLDSIGYFSGDGKRNYGTMMHGIVSRVETIDDIRHAVECKILSGELHEGEKEHLVQELTDFLSIPEVAEWYSGKYKILNETQVLHPHFGFSRPDRVMLGIDKVVVVDYKFGEAEDAKYKRQIRHYVERIKEMGYENVSGFVFYVKLRKIVEV